MIARYNRISLLWGVSGIIVQVAGAALAHAITLSAREKPGPSSIDYLLLFPGGLIVMIGLGYYVNGKAWRPVWRGMALLLMALVLVPVESLLVDLFAIFFFLR